MRRDSRGLGGLLAVALIALAVVGWSGFVSTPDAQADVCNDIPSVPLVPNPIKTGCKIVSKVPEVVSHPGKAVTDIATAPLRSAGDEVMKGVTKWVADGASWLVGQAGKLIDETTTPRIASPWFTGQYGSMAGLAAVFALPLLLASVLQAVLRRDAGIVMRAAFVHLPAAFILTAGAVAVVSMLLTLTDDMSTQVASSVGNDATSFLSDVGKALGTLSATTGNPAVPLFAVFLGGLIAAIGAFFVWVELLIRSAAIYVTVLFLPFTFVAMIWPSTAKWCRRLVELLFAIIVSKFVIVAIMALAAAGLGQSRADDAFQGVLAGTALMLLAALSPLALLRLIPLAEVAAHSNGRSGAGSQTLGPIAGPAATMRRVVDANWGGTAGGGGLRASPSGAGAGGPAGVAAAGVAGGAQAMTGAVRTRAQGIGGQAGGGGPAPADGARYAATGGGGQAARPASPSPAAAAASSGAAGAPAPPPSRPERSGAVGGPAPRGSSVPGGGGRPPVPAPRDPARDRQSGGKGGR